MSCVEGYGYKLLHVWSENHECGYVLFFIQGGGIMHFLSLLASVVILFTANVTQATASDNCQKFSDPVSFAKSACKPDEYLRCQVSWARSCIKQDICSLSKGAYATSKCGSSTENYDCIFKLTKEHEKACPDGGNKQGKPWLPDECKNGVNNYLKTCAGPMCPLDFMRACQ